MPDLDPLTGKDPSSLTVAQLAERLAMERALREKEYVALRETLQSVKELFAAAAISDRRALELQASEYERRLDALNHAHQAAVEAAAKTVPRELFDAYVKETSNREDALVAAQSDKFNVAVGALNDRIDSLDRWRSGVEGRIIGIMAAFGLVVTIINIGLHFIKFGT